MKNIQIYRRAEQLLFVTLLVLGFYMDARMVIMILLPATLIFGNFFCGWVCPYGSLQDLFGMIGRKLFKQQFKMPTSIQKYMQYSRYLLMVISITGLIGLIMENINGYGTFLSLWMNGGAALTITIAMFVMISYLIIALIFERPFCNYLCVEAVKYGVLSMTRIFTIKRNSETCINCKKCNKRCPMNIDIASKAHVRNGQCINCFECIGTCPVDKTLTYGRVKRNLRRNK